MMLRKVGFLSKSLGRTLMIWAILLASASLATADIPAGGVSTIIWSGWGDTTSSPVTFTITAESSTDLGIDDYSNNFCFPSDICGHFPGDPVMDWDSGDPAPSPFPPVGGTITIPPDMQFFCNGTEDENGVCEGDTASDLMTVDFSTPFVLGYFGETFVCGGDAFVACGFQVADGELLIRFDGPAVVPEPGSWLLLLSAAAVLLPRAGRLRKRSC